MRLIVPMILIAMTLAYRAALPPWPRPGELCIPPDPPGTQYLLVNGRPASRPATRPISADDVESPRLQRERRTR